MPQWYSKIILNVIDNNSLEKSFPTNVALFGRDGENIISKVLELTRLTSITLIN